MRILMLAMFASLALAQDGATRADWPYHGGSQLAWRYSSLDQLNRGNVSKLTLAWAFQTGDYEMGLQSTPIVTGGRLYLSTSRSQVYSLDAATGKVFWQYKYPLPRANVPYGPQNRGIAVGGGYVLLATYDDYLIAIDQYTGQEVWKTNLDDIRQCGCTVTGAPLVVKDKVIVGGAGGDSAHRGYLTAVYLKTGRVAWRFYTIPGPGEKGHETWKGESWKFGGGATWLTGSFDPELNMVYWGVGNAAADLDAGPRYSGEGEGANLYTASVIALDADTGKLKWYHQEVPKDVWDFDSAYECVLIDREMRGQMRKLLVHINKGGYAFVLDRVTGEYVNGFPIVDNHTWTTGLTEDGKFVGRVEPVQGKATLICPSALGGKSWNEMAFSPRTGFLYTPSSELCSQETVVPQEAHEGRNFTSGSWPFVAPPNGPAHGHLDAYDPVSGKRQWSYPSKYLLLASILATGGDLIFTGDPEGFFFALDARTGEKLWSFQTGSGHRGSAVTYMINGRQYVATPSGWGSLASSAFPDLFPETDTFRGGSTLMVFALPEGTR